MYTPLCSVNMDIESGESDDVERCDASRMLTCVLILGVVGLVVASWF